EVVLGITFAVGWLIVFGLGGRLLLDQDITEGELFAFAMAFSRLRIPLVGTGWALANIQKGRASYLRLRDAFAIPTDTGGAPLTSTNRDLVVQNLSYSRGGKPILANISF